MKNELATFMRDARISANLTQKDISDKFGYTSAQFVSNWERGLAAIPIKSVKKFCKITSIDTAQLADLLLNDYRIQLQKELRVELAYDRQI